MTEPGANALYLAGRDRKGTLEAALGAICALEVVEAYAAEARRGWRPDEVRALAVLCDRLTLFAAFGRACGPARRGGGPLDGQFAAMAACLPLGGRRDAAGGDQGRAYLCRRRAR